MVAYTKRQQRKEEDSERRRGERDLIKIIDHRFERWQVVRFSSAPRLIAKNWFPFCYPFFWYYPIFKQSHRCS